MDRTVQFGISNQAVSAPGYDMGRPSLKSGLAGGAGWRRLALKSIVAVSLLTGAVGLFGAFGPVGNGVNQQPLAYLAATGAAAATPNAADSEATLVEKIAFGSVDFLPPAATQVEFIRMEVAPGGTISVLADAESHTLYFVESGSLDALFEFDVQITEDGEPHGVLIGGEPRHFEAGEGFVMESNFDGELRNTGTERLKLAIIRIVHAPASQATDSETIHLP